MHNSQDAEIKKRAYFSSSMPRQFEMMNLVLTLGMMWFRKVDLDAESKEDNLVPQKC